MPRALKPCPHCGAPTPETPCSGCAYQHRRPRSGKHARTPHQQGLGSAWRRLAARAKKRQPWCGWPLGCDFEVTKDNPLTGDHIVPRTRAPERALDPTNVIVLCRRHNSIKARSGLPNPR